jgi:hypothetical protein
MKFNLHVEKYECICAMTKSQNAEMNHQMKQSAGGKKK